MVRKTLVQDTLTQNDWGVRPIPAGWKAHRDASGVTFYFNKTINQWAPNYESMFEVGQVEDEVEILTQRSSSSSQESPGGSLNMQAAGSKKPFKKRQASAKEIDTQDLPGSDFMIAAGREFVHDENEKENEEILEEDLETQQGDEDEEEEECDDDPTQW
jgi:hypothetical protein